MSLPACAQMMSNVLYSKRFFPYSVSNVMAGLDDDDISIVDEVKGTLPRPPALTKAPLAALSRGGGYGGSSYPGGYPPGLLPTTVARGSMQVLQWLFLCNWF